MNSEPLHAILISDFNLDIFSGYLGNDPESPSLVSHPAPFGQVFPTLLQPWERDYDIALVWTQPEHVIPSFRKALDFEPFSMADVLREVDEFSKAISNIRERARFVFVPTWVLAPYQRGHGGIGFAGTLAAMNQRLAENLDHIHFLNAQRWFAGRRAFSSKSWYMGKVPFSNEVFSEAARDVKASMRALLGQSRKLIIVDLDDTLWGGVVGDVGSENLRLGGHDFVGEAFVDFQKTLRAFRNRGILLGIVSKNEEQTALDAFKHPEMALSLSDFAGWKINWSDKAKNISELAAELNIGLQSIVFIDDNPAERAWVQEALPEVLVPEWPSDVTLSRETLLALPCFDSVATTDEDRKRAEFYLTDRDRKVAAAKAPSHEEWLKSLDIKVKVSLLNKTNLQRTAQLLNKTNQMNLSTRRMTEAELWEWASSPDHKVWTFSVSDKFGDSGLVGIASMAASGQVVDFILSCRVMGRTVEEAMLYFLINHAKKTLSFLYQPTEKNKPCLDFLRRSGLVEAGHTFTWNTTRTYPAPPAVLLEELL